MESFGFNPEIVLTHDERGQVVQAVAMPGHKILHRLMRSEVDKFIVDLINTEAGDDASVLAKHRLSKAAAQFYQSLTNRINFEVQQHVAVQGQSGVIQDTTEDGIDLGARPSTLEDFEHGLLEEDSLYG